MAARILKCPNCGAPLTPHRFARTAVCAYCESVVQLDEAVVAAARFREAYDAWTKPAPDDGREWLRIGRDHWTPIALLARGEIADVYAAERARQPTERALIKVLRDENDVAMLDAEWTSLAHLQSNDIAGATAISQRLPQPVARGVIEGGAHAGKHATILRRAPAFDHTFEDVRRVHPRGVGDHVAVWMWRRILETLSFLHRSGIVHGAVLPQHLLVERGEHGVRLVGYGCSGHPDDPLAAVVLRHESMYPDQLLTSQRLACEHDVTMSARCVAYVLGTDGEARVAGKFHALLDAVGCGIDVGDAWSLRERVGTIARELLGPPSFHPLAMPGDPSH